MPLPPAIVHLDQVWDRVGEVLEVVYRTIEDMSPPAWSFVFPNVLVDDDPGDRAIVARLADLAGASGRAYLPVRLRCDLDPNLERVTSPERGPRHKWTDRDAVERFIRAHHVVEVDALDLDTTTSAPEVAAQQIVDHWRGVTGLPYC